MDSHVAVTGAEGFIGSHLVEQLVANGHHVRAMTQYNSFGTRGWLDGLPAAVLDCVTVIPGDVRDVSTVTKLVAGCQTVYHLAALVSVPHSYEAPRMHVETNVLGTLNVLEAVRAAGIPRVVHTSTSETYGSARYVPMDEKHPQTAQSPYAASKIGADRVAESYHHAYGVPVVTVRPFNTFGPRQSLRAVIPTVICQALEGRREIHLGSLSPVRDFTYCGDTAAAFLAAGGAPDDAVVGQVFNVGSGEAISIGDLVALIGEIVGSPLHVEADDQRVRPDSSEVSRLVCDSRLFRSTTAWSPQLTLREGLELTVKWFSEPANRSRYLSTAYAI
ncbi:GDP-mannose 4,6-dehydratase [Streptomyces sp. CHA1]|uniref:GDP-mannose 4,6-dehydratase n=1 Tax=unclassified Streptomyces TaxID=2593676 RepID=UPI001BFC2011|nr:MULTISPECIES: GDP-mannose 4,6-dehydratase [unclassified Streptomyces]MBT3157722.1 GDP-mannose 4,6-dehydratase [Streptomyces sp. G11C]MCO6703099.1 GDP-mannose 4,6-dehydratase [Streptomyces sp. CHB9.2]MCO6709536.1 GDP-mannose 4,6-dehydratase [Streptomyces sp. CHA3]MCO6715279.1 GDP-mannose 4,6-dehydratase [Streptomyces sp. CHB19.2]MCO6721404.1 GDP-mannose 4,6-dehydratase [Streptomyces sp. Vc714c-19]